MSLWQDRTVERPSATVFVGREGELDELLTTVGALESTGARTVLIAGEAGIGKSRLVAELLDRARSSGLLTAVGVCTPTSGGGLAYAPFVGALRDIGRQLDAPAADAMLAPARRALGLDDTGTDFNLLRRSEAVLACFDALGERRRTIVVFEDLHWADAASLEMLDFLTRNLGAAPVCIVVTYRNDEVDHGGVLGSTLAELVRHRAVIQLELQGLDRDATATLMSGMLDEPPDWALLDAVHARSGGNPFFAEELTAARNTPALPTTLRNVVMFRIERLSADARTVVAVAAAAGLFVDHRVLEAACDVDDDQLHAAITETIAGHVLVADDATRLRFCHALQREAMYDSLLPSERTRLHARLASVLAARDDVRADAPGFADGELAYHWWGAGEWEYAMLASERAGDAMSALLAMPEAYLHYARAVDAYERCDEIERTSVDGVNLFVKAATAADLVGETARTYPLLKRALDLADGNAAPERLAEALAIYGRRAGIAGEVSEAFASFDRARSLLPEEPTAGLARVVAYEGALFMGMGRMEMAIARCTDAIEIAKAAGARDFESHALCTMGPCLVETGEIDAGIAIARAARDIAEETAQPDLLDRAYCNLSHVLLTAGRLDDAAMLVKNATTGEWFAGIRLAGSGQNSSEALIRAGRFDEATDLLDHMPERGTASCVFGPYAIRTMLALRQGRFDDAVRFLAAADELGSLVAAYQGHGISHLLHAEFALEQSQPDEAYGEIEQALVDVDLTDDHVVRPEMCAYGIRALADRYDAARVRRRTIDLDKLQRQAAALIEQAEADLVVLARPGFAAPPRTRAFVALCRAEATRLDEPNPDAWRAAIAAWETAAEPWPTAYCQWRLANVALALPNGRGEGTAALTAAWTLAREMGAAPLLGRVEALAQRARITLAADMSTEQPSRSEQVAQDLGLTAREVEVLDQLARGLTDRQIADALFISKKTVSVHVSNILRKLDAGNRVDAGEIGQRVGLGRTVD
jgi:DNA-binding CsgD family transcriptional regulator/tetratricopeptide (TPR) repeat protein